MYDIKLNKKEKHLKYTGVSNDIILKNLFKLNELNARIILIPLKSKSVIT